jgi:hypothetical protein
MIGEKYNDCSNWLDFIPINNKSIKYLEIGVYYGFNLLSVLQTYCKDDNCELHAIDPYANEHYNHYNDLINKGDEIYDACMKNINSFGEKDKIHIYRGYSYEKIQILPNNYFDMIYIDGCHEPESVMEDAVLSFRKLKNDGYIIFDDYYWSDKTTKSIDSFISAYSNRIKILGVKNSQIFVQKINNLNVPSVSFNF